MIDSIRSGNAAAKPKFEMIAGGFASKSAHRPEGAAFAALGQDLAAEHAKIVREAVQEVITRLTNTMQGAESVLTAIDLNLSNMKTLVDCVSKKAHEIAKKEKSLNVAMQALAQCQPTFVNIDDQLHLVVSPSKLNECASLLAKTLKLPCFFSPGIGLVEVEEEPLFGGWRCSPVPVAELAKALRAKVHLHRLRGLGEGPSAGDVNLYDHFAKELAGTGSFNGYFPELTGMVFVGHTTSDGRVIKRSGFDWRTGLYAMTRKPFRAANDEPMAVAA